MFKEKLRNYLIDNEITQTELSEIIGDSQQAISDFLKKEGNPQRKTKEKYFTKLIGFEEFYNKKTSIKQEITEDSSSFNQINNKNGSSFIDIGNNLYIMKMPLLEISAQAGFIDNYQDLEFLAEISTYHTIIVNEVHRGKYIAFRVNGDSMDNGFSDAILPNSIVTGRELSRDHWKDKLRFKKFPYWIIGTEESSYPLLKQITSHNTDKGTITCHSLNTGPEHNDFELELNKITTLFYVVDINRVVADKIY